MMIQRRPIHACMILIALLGLFAGSAQAHGFQPADRAIPCVGLPCGPIVEVQQRGGLLRQFEIILQNFDRSDVTEILDIMAGYPGYRSLRPIEELERHVAIWYETMDGVANLRRSLSIMLNDLGFRVHMTFEGNVFTIRRLTTTQRSPVVLSADQQEESDRIVSEISPQPGFEAPPRTDIYVEFEFDKHRLTAEARRRLDSLGIALNNPRFRNSVFELRGHTDAVGSNAYNLALSDRRARSVACYLIERHALPRQALRPIGFGERELKNPAEPEADENRRVEVINWFDPTSAGFDRQIDWGPCPTE